MVESKQLILFCLLLAICVFSAPVDNEDDEDDTEVLELVDLNPERSAPKQKWPMTEEKPYRVIVPIKIRKRDYSKYDIKCNSRCNFYF